MSKQPIEPKPTQYGNILFRSRLEARWAVFLDYTENVVNWIYEPKTFVLENGWKYTPDFCVKVVSLARTRKLRMENFYLEVKPSTITEQYRNTIARFSTTFEVPIFVVQGDFYKERSAILSHLHIGNGQRVPITYDKLFANTGRGYYFAHHHRFDLKG